MNKYYIYLHVSLKTGKVFYVGKGCGKRAKSKSGRSKEWQDIVGKEGYKITFAYENLSEEQAFFKEIETISEYLKNGHALTNKTLGGEGALGASFTEDHKEKIRQSKLGRARTEEEKKAISEGTKNAMTSEIKKKISDKAKQRIVTDETKRKLSEVMKKRVFTEEHRKNLSAYYTPENRKKKSEQMKKAMTSEVRKKISEGNKGKILPPEVREKISKNNCLRRPEIKQKHLDSVFRKAVKCSNGMEFKSVKEAVDWLISQGFEKANNGNISSCAAGRLKTAYGYKWAY